MSTLILRRALASLTEADLRAVIDGIYEVDEDIVTKAVEGLLKEKGDAPATPPAVTDADGDTWLLNAEGKYAFRSYGPHTLDELREKHGPLTTPGASV